MAGRICKIIINNGVQGLMRSLEEILISPAVRDVMLEAKICDTLIQRLADIDLAVYRGGTILHGGLRGVLKELEAVGLVTAEVWEVFSRS